MQSVGKTLLLICVTLILSGCGATAFRDVVYMNSATSGAFLVFPDGEVRDGDSVLATQTSAYCMRSNGVVGIFRDGPISNQYMTGRRYGAVDITIDFENGDAPLYGLYLGCGNSESFGQNIDPTVTIPDRFINAARAGQVTVVHETQDQGSSFTEVMDVYAWVLWLSDSPDKLR